MISSTAWRLVERMFEMFPLRQTVRALDTMSTNRVRNRGMLSQAFEFIQVNGIPGDYLEFGVWRGDTFAMAHRFKKRLGLDQMKMWAFDSFEGLPEGEDEKYSTFAPGQYACSEEAFRKILRKRGIRAHEFETVRGYYERSLNGDLRKRMQDARAAIVWIDCDLYSSAKQVLEFCPPLLQDGTVLCFDDFYFYRGAPDKGEQRALREFAEEHPEIRLTPYIDFAPAGKSFLTHIHSAE